MFFYSMAFLTLLSRGGGLAAALRQVSSPGLRFVQSSHRLVQFLFQRLNLLQDSRVPENDKSNAA